MMLLSQGTSYWDAPELLAAQWSEPSEAAPAGGHVPPGLHSKSFRDSSGLGMGLGFDLASPGSSARTQRRPSAGALSDAPSDCLPVPETVAGAYAAGYRRETLGTAPVLPSESGEGAGEQQQRAVGQAMSPRAPAAGSPTRPTRRGSAANHPLESGPSGREALSVAVSGFDGAGGGAGQRRLHDPNRLALYQHSNHGLEIRLANCEQWRAEQERPPFRSCFQLWGKMTRYRCDLGCILLKMAAISLLTGPASGCSSLARGWAFRRWPLLLRSRQRQERAVSTAACMQRFSLGWVAHTDVVCFSR